MVHGDASTSSTRCTLILDVMDRHTLLRRGDRILAVECVDIMLEGARLLCCRRACRYIGPVASAFPANVCPSNVCVGSRSSPFTKKTWMKVSAHS
mmetsp:Transcript_27192/g.76367  ORF Transcript_27192/g.76367 Transcript_27192/m.76367 type:complete len:95 (-) Transcript_27192:314-598(-)|eukprot:scaffold38946_cov41-Tisochrysis_lutea.AAC.2